MHSGCAHVEVFVHACLLSTILVLFCYMPYLVLIIWLILIICFNTCLIPHLSHCLALCCNSPADCSYKSHHDSGSDPSRVLVRISGENCAYSRFSNLIPFSPSGLRDPRGFNGKCTEHTAISYTVGFKLNMIMYARQNGNR